MERTNDGFVIAEEDLKMRGSGNVLGTQQSGKNIFRHVRPWEDYGVMQKARDEAVRLMEMDPMLINYPELRKRAESLTESEHGE
jgi:ATP-dependent DNA helicase RecG